MKTFANASLFSIVLLLLCYFSPQQYRPLVLFVSLFLLFLSFVITRFEKDMSFQINQKKKISKAEESRILEKKILDLDSF